MSKLYGCTFFSTCWLILHLLTASESLAKTVYGVVGKKVTLPCKYDQKYHGGRPICWGRAEIPLRGCDQEIIATNGDRVTRRTSWRYMLMGTRQGDVSLIILNAQETDSGTYGCRIDIAGWFNDEKYNVKLIVKKAPTTTVKAVTTSPRRTNQAIIRHTTAGLHTEAFPGFLTTSETLEPTDGKTDQVPTGIPTTTDRHTHAFPGFLTTSETLEPTDGKTDQVPTGIPTTTDRHTHAFPGFLTTSETLEPTDGKTDQVPTGIPTTTDRQTHAPTTTVKAVTTSPRQTNQAIIRHTTAGLHTEAFPGFLTTSETPKPTDGKTDQVLTGIPTTTDRHTQVFTLSTTLRVYPTGFYSSVRHDLVGESAEVTGTTLTWVLAAVPPSVLFFLVIVFLLLKRKRRQTGSLTLRSQVANGSDILLRHSDSSLNRPGGDMAEAPL